MPNHTEKQTSKTTVTLASGEKLEIPTEVVYRARSAKNVALFEELRAIAKKYGVPCWVGAPMNDTERLQEADVGLELSSYVCTPTSDNYYCPRVTTSHELVKTRPGAISPAKCSFYGVLP